MIDIEVDVRDLLAAPPALQRAYLRAGRRAVTKTMRWVRTQGRRAVASAANVPQRTLTTSGRNPKGRWTAKGLAGTVWFGIEPIKAGYLGTPRQTKRGAKVRRMTFPGAFVATMPSGHRGIFRRREGALTRPANNRWGITTLPIDEVRVPLTGAQAALEALSERVPSRLATVFGQELNYEINVRGLKR